MNIILPKATIFKMLIIALGFVALIFIRQYTQAFALSLGYLYVALISLAGFWFCITGGLLAASISSLIFLLEIYMFPGWFAHDLVLNGLYLRLFVYFFAGSIIGFMSCREKVMKKRLEELAYFDELTGCVNYRWTMKSLAKEISRSKRYGKIISIVMIDIDHFKKINDEYGHITCNRLLKAFTELLISTFRDSDIVGRYGGEEFLVILPETSPEHALLAMDRIKEKLPSIEVQLQQSRELRNIPFTFSAGISSFPYNGEKINELIAFADNALYRAKKVGRDRVFIEKRRWTRLKPVPGLTLEIIDLTKNERISTFEVKDISQRGMLLILPQDIKTDELLCRLNFTKDGFQTEFKGKVVRKDVGSDNKCSIGVYF